jgi:hypothetical protein
MTKAGNIAVDAKKNLRRVSNLRVSNQKIAVLFCSM